MATVDINAIISAVRDSMPAGATATSIAHTCGFSKAARIKDELISLVTGGKLQIDSSGRYEVYKVPTAVASANKSVVADGAKNEKVTVLDGDKVEQKLPEASESDLRGYKVDSIKVDGKIMKKIVTPDGKKIRMESDERLLVINNSPKFVVKSAEDVITCMRKFAMDSGLTVFTIEDLKQNRKVSNDKDVVIKDDHILFMSIKKHNKAA